MLSFQECNFWLVYFPCDKAFHIAEVDVNYFKKETYEQYIGNGQKSTKVQIEFDGESYQAIIITVAKEVEDLKFIFERCCTLKNEPYNYTVEQVLKQVPRFHCGKRVALPNLKVSYSVWILFLLHHLSFAITIRQNAEKFWNVLPRDEKNNASTKKRWSSRGVKRKKLWKTRGAEEEKRRGENRVDGVRGWEGG